MEITHMVGKAHFAFISMTKPRFCTVWIVVLALAAHISSLRFADFAAPLQAIAKLLSILVLPLAFGW